MNIYLDTPTVAYIKLAQLASRCQEPQAFRGAVIGFLRQKNKNMLIAATQTNHNT